MNTLSQPMDRSASLSSEQTPATCQRSGFTLVEIMAATGIMVAVILLVLSLTTNVLNTWNFSSGQLAQNYEARIAMDFLGQDLEASVFRSNGMAWMEVRYQDVGSGSAMANDQTQLFFFSPVTDRPRELSGSDIAGDICAVAYLTDFQNPFTGGTNAAADGDRPQFGLYRSVVDAKNTFDTALSLDDFVPASAGNSLYGLWDGGTMNAVDEAGSAERPVTINRISVAANYMSANVVNFQIIFYYRATDGDIVAITDDGRATGTPRDFVVADGLYTAGAAGGGYSRVNDYSSLVYADIKMTVLNDDGANMVANGTWGDVTDPANDWDKFTREYGENFTRRVYIMSNPI